MMNKQTRKLSKMLDEVRAEISPYFLERSAIKNESAMTQKISKLDDSAEFVRCGLTVSFSLFPHEALNLLCIQKT